MTDELRTTLKVEISWIMREVASRRTGKIDWEEIAEELINKDYIHLITPDQRSKIWHDFKRISGALDSLFKDIVPTIEEDGDVKT